MDTVETKLIPAPTERPLIQPECEIKLEFRFVSGKPVVEGRISLKWINVVNPEDSENILQASIDDANGYDIHTLAANQILEEMWAQAAKQRHVMIASLGGSDDRQRSSNEGS